jgi:hypothetical protein
MFRGLLASIPLFSALRHGRASPPAEQAGECPDRSQANRENVHHAPGLLRHLKAEVDAGDRLELFEA